MLTYRPQPQVFRNVPGEAGAAPAPEAAASADPAPTTDSTPAPASAPADPDFSWLPEQYRGETGPDLAGFRTHYEDLTANLAALTENAPETPDAYEFATPDDLDFGDIEAPEWFEFQIDPENPVLNDLRSWMHEMKMPAEAAKGLTGMLAKYEAWRASQYEGMARQEMASLGQGHQARLDRITRAVETRVGNEKQRAALLQSLTTADAVRALETLISGFSTPSTPPSPPGAATEGLTGFRRLQAARGG